MMKNEPLSAARYREIRDAAGNVLLKHGISSLPVYPAQIITSIEQCKLIRFSKFADKMLYFGGYCTTKFFGTRDACTLYEANSGRYLVCYNDSSAAFNPARSRWTFAHELGHIILGHAEGLRPARDHKEGPTISENPLLEREADYFAAMLLAHPAVLAACGATSPRDIVRLCGISPSAAENRYRSMANSSMIPSLIDGAVLDSFRGFILDQIGYQPQVEAGAFQL